jgi:hypothetical protein
MSLEQNNEHYKYIPYMFQLFYVSFGHKPDNITPGKAYLSRQVVEVSEGILSTSS